jgi:uncharacterized protein (DUF983 family)
MVAWHRGSDPNAFGHYIETKGAGRGLAVDCPRCRYGTLKRDSKSRMSCIDCGTEYTVSELVERGVLPKHG